MVAILKHICLMATLLATAARADYKYIAQFVACDTQDCMHKPIVEQHANWKWVKDGQCKSYLRHTFPGWSYRWNMTPNGRSCPACPDAFGNCTITVFEHIACGGRVVSKMENANQFYRGPEFSPGILTDGAEGASVSVECVNDWQS